VKRDVNAVRINRWGPDRAAGEVNLVYGKNTKWLLFDPNQRQKLAQ
jgi:hypothetical protein